MACTDKTIKELLSAYLEEAVDEAERQQVKQHLETCEDCRTELSLLGMIADDPVPDPGEAFWVSLPGKIHRAVETQNRERKRFLNLSWLRDRMAPPRWSLAAAGLALVLIVSWLVVNPLQKQHGETALNEVYDSGYGSMHDPVLTHPSTNMSDLSGDELASVDGWAGRELTTIGLEAETIVLNPLETDPAEELADLDTHEIDRLSKMVNEWYEEG